MVAQVIFEKIEKSNAFIADLTFIPGEKGKKKTPNPNVLIEYGFALRALGDGRIIAVFNNAFGSPEELPFDLRHRRHPIQYTLYEGEDDPKVKKEQLEQLSKKFKSAIKAILTSFADKPDGENGVEGKVKKKDLTQTIKKKVQKYFAFYSKGEIGSISTDYLQKEGQSNKINVSPEAPYLYLFLTPKTEQVKLTNSEARGILQESIEPLGSLRAGGWNYGRNEFGPISYSFFQKDLNSAYRFAQLSKSREVLGVDYYLLSPRKIEETKFPYIPTQAIEEILIDGLLNFLRAAKDRLELNIPLDFGVGLRGVKGYRLAVDFNYFSSTFMGEIIENEIDYFCEIKSLDEDPFEILLPFFNKFYDEADLERPNVRTQGRRR